jgi:uncharacterized repeat protein (TIGR02543 family)
MKNKYFRLFLSLLIAASVCFFACENPIIEKWWDEIGSPEAAITASKPYHMVFFQTNGGAPYPGEQQIAHGGKVVKVPMMTRKTQDESQYYGFGGWFSDPGYTNEWDFNTGRVMSDLTLYAKWSLPPPPFHTVRFETNGGNPTVGDIYILEGTKIPEPPAIRKAQAAYEDDPRDERLVNVWMSFGGWYSDSAFTTPWNFATDRVGGSDITLYAKWDPALPKTVTFEANGGEPAPRTQDVYPGTRLTEPFAMSKTGYGFAGWYDKNNKLWDFAVDTVSDDMTLYAKWVTNYYTVLFNSNGGTPHPENQIVAYGSKIEKPAMIRKTGGAFLGWYKDAGFRNEWDFDTDTVTENIVLYAYWGAAHYTVVFVMGTPPGTTIPPSSHPQNQSLNVGGKVTEPPVPASTGYSFYGWYYYDGSNPTVISQLATNITTRNDYLIPWNFDTAVDEYTDANQDLYLYARWVPPVPDMVWVQKGSFMMGDASVTGATPARRVNVNGFYMSLYPVTQGEYSSVMSSAIPSPPSQPSAIAPSHFGSGNPIRTLLPVEQVSWYDAVEYCYQLTAKDASLSPVYSRDGITRTETKPNATDTIYPIQSMANLVVDWNASGYRLPTEAEWEYAAKGGNGSPGNYQYSGSDVADNVAWYNTNTSTAMGGTGTGTQVVGGKDPNDLGIYDMSGNIAEWCWDWYITYTRLIALSPAVDVYNNPKGPPDGTANISGRTRRGGSWNNAVGNIRNMIRTNNEPTDAMWTIGFRVVRGPSEIW